MSQSEVVTEEIARVIDLLEQIKDVDRIIQLHQDAFMTKQYRYRKEKFVKELKDLLLTFNITAADLAA